MVNKIDKRFKFTTEVRVRLPETDAVGIVFYGAFFTYFEVGRMEYMRKLGVSGDRFMPIKDFQSVVVKTCCEFRSPARLYDDLVIYVRMAEIKDSSFRFEFLIYHKQEKRLVAEGHSIHVALDVEKWKSIYVPESFRKTIRKYEGKFLTESKL